jgi:hypothetical protein
MDIIYEFLTTTLAAAGGIVEPLEHGLEGLLPQAVGERLGLPEEFRIQLDEAGEAPGSIDGRLGSPLLERLLHERLAAPPLAAVALPAELPRPLPASQRRRILSSGGLLRRSMNFFCGTSGATASPSFRLPFPKCGSS